MGSNQERLPFNDFMDLSIRDDDQIMVGPLDEGQAGPSTWYQEHHANPINQNVPDQIGVYQPTPGANGPFENSPMYGAASADGNSFVPHLIEENINHRPGVMPMPEQPNNNHMLGNYWAPYHQPQPEYTNLVNGGFNQWNGTNQIIINQGNGNNHMINNPVPNAPTRAMNAVPTTAVKATPQSPKKEGRKSTTEAKDDPKRKKQNRDSQRKFRAKQITKMAALERQAKMAEANEQAAQAKAQTLESDKQALEARILTLEADQRPLQALRQENEALRERIEVLELEGRRDSFQPRPQAVGPLEWLTGRIS